MIGLGVGVGDVSTCSLGDLTGFVPNPISVKSGGTVPSSSRLYDLQTLSEMVDYATNIDTNNYETTEPLQSITSVVLQILVGGNWVAENGSQRQEGALLQLRFLVTSSSGETRAFNVLPIQIEYKYRVTENGSEADVDINDLVPDSEIIAFTLSSFSGDNAHYNGDYALTAGAIRNTVTLPDTVLINFTGAVDALVVGSVLRANDGLVLSSTAAVTFTRRWLRDGVPIPGEDGLTYTVVAADEGAVVSLEVTPDDGVNVPVPVLSQDVPITDPTPVPSIAFSFFGSSDSAGVASHVPNSDLTIGRQQIVLLATRCSNGNKHIDGFTVDGPGTQALAYESTGVPAARANEGNDQLVKVAFGLHTSTATSHSYAVVPNVDAIQSLVGIVELETAVAFSIVEYSSAGDATPELNIDVLAGDVVLGLFNFDAAANDKTLGAGFSTLHFSNGNPDMRTVLASHVVTTDETARPFGVNTGDVDNVACMLIRMRAV
ncbi:hypothetical protein [uncultured Roseobacter sp.]|uniref:hypothetical protein n=1 Tax=uncultured Roseobacter sp. TaxID=114847 RepID=UPI00262454B7|nr:hypothetical protein [uncultured Roseobacter sp.]